MCTFGKVYRSVSFTKSVQTCFFANHNNCYTVVQSCQEAGRPPEPHHNTTPSPLTCHKDKTTCCLHYLNVTSVPCKTGGHRGKFLLHTPAATAAYHYRDKWAASLVRAGRSCLLPLVPVAIPSSPLYLLGGSNSRKNLKGGQGLEEVKSLMTTMMAMAEAMATVGQHDKEWGSDNAPLTTMIPSSTTKMMRTKM
jgi:hypothetical protein